MHDIASRRTGFWRHSALVAVLLAGLPLAACQTGPGGETAPIEAAQGSEQNIASLSAVIARSPQDAEAYSMRAQAYGRAGQYRDALQDFDKAIAGHRFFGRLPTEFEP